MKTLVKRIASLTRRFWHREDGIMVAELVMVLPLFVFCTITLYSYWDGFRALNSSQKASYTVSDMIARTMQPVSPDYLVGLRNTMQYMIGDNLPVSMRVTSVTWTDTRNRFEVLWSNSPSGAMPALTTATLQDVARFIPELADGDTAIIMETNTAFRPIFSSSNLFRMYLMPEDFRQFIVTRPRFLPEVCLTTVVCN